MDVPFFSLSEQHKKLKTEIFDKWEELYDRTEFVYGKTGKEFEKDFAKYTGQKYAIALDSGTSAVEISLRAAGISEGDEVITVANTFIATVAPIHFVGAKPVFVDINPQTLNIDINKIEEKITSKTKAILPVYLYGQPVEMQRINEIANKHNLIVIADSAQAIGSRIKQNDYWKSSAQFADISAFSFYPGKNLGACGEGGAIVTDNKDYAEFATLFRDHGMDEKYVHQILGRNHRMHALQAAALKVKLNYIDEWNEKRRELAEIYINELKDIENVEFQHTPQNIEPVYHLFVVLVKNRETFRKYLSDNGIGTSLHYKYPVHLQDAFSNLDYNKGDLPITEKIVSENVSLPMYPELKKKQVSRVCNTIKNYFKNEVN